MSCCGHRPLRPDGAGGGSVYGGPTSHAATGGGPAGPDLGAAAGRPTDPEFRYVGASSLTVTGPVTGRAYRFPAPGARLAVNRHDAPSLLYVPSLQPVRR
jgi:hypothetical protein